MPAVEILAVGTEILLGQLADTNTRWIAERLAESGIDVLGTRAVGDNRERICAAFQSALQRVDGVISTGGLGPTVDDLTKEAVCDAFGLQTEVHDGALRSMAAVFHASGREMRGNNRKQAEVPQGALVLDNPNGTAPGFVAFGPNEKFIACMPGVPGEMKPMLRDRLIPWLRSHLGASGAISTRVVHTVGIAESEIDHRIDDLFRSLENPKIAVLAHGFRCDVKIMMKAESPQAAQAAIAPIEAEIAKRLDGFVYGVDDRTLPGAIHDELQRRGETIAVAESCTGGSICAALTSVAGSSKSFVGGVVAYDNAVKTRELGVQSGTLAREGAVSEAVALEMARGVRARLGATHGLASTGIAGPGGATGDKPAGLVWLAFADTVEEAAVRLHLAGDRSAVQSRATVAALGMLWRRVAEKGTKRPPSA